MIDLLCQHHLHITTTTDNALLTPSPAQNRLQTMSQSPVHHAASLLHLLLYHHSVSVNASISCTVDGRQGRQQDNVVCTSRLLVVEHHDLYLYNSVSPVSPQNYE